MKTKHATTGERAVTEANVRLDIRLKRLNLLSAQCDKITTELRELRELSHTIIMDSRLKEQGAQRARALGLALSDYVSQLMRADLAKKISMAERTPRVSRVERRQAKKAREA